MYYVGLDIGTSSLKCVVIDTACDIVYEHGYSYAFDEPREGYREIDPDVWFQAVLHALQDIHEKFDGTNISTIGVTGQMHTTVFLDAQGNCVRKAIMWNDLRSSDMVAPLKERLAKREDTKYIAKILSTGSPAMNTLWVKEQEPEVFLKVRKIMTAYDYIVYRLTGEYSADYCDASTSSMYDIVSKQWSGYMLDILGIDDHYLGPIYASCDVVGTLREELCEQLCINKRIKVIAGTGDNPANAVAMGVLDQQQPVLSLGTSGVIILAKEDKDFEGLGKNVVFNAQHDRFVNVVQGTVRSAGGTHKWWVENIVESSDMGIDQDRLRNACGKEHHILFFPHITGDKMIYQDINTRGAFIGLSANSKREDMLQAVFEGVGYALREVMENMHLKAWPKRMQINGGGTRSDVWMNIMANILHCELEEVSMNASPGYGVALLAGKVDGIEKKESQKTTGKVYVPCDNQVNIYEKQYRKYQRMYGALKEIMEDEPLK
ncbi:xylulokinase [Amedibacillus sp. YH-ame6]